jgi:hypothetical protein
MYVALEQNLNIVDYFFLLLFINKLNENVEHDKINDYFLYV